VSLSSLKQHLLTYLAACYLTSPYSGKGGEEKILISRKGMWKICCPMASFHTPYGRRAPTDFKGIFTCVKRTRPAVNH